MSSNEGEELLYSLRERAKELQCLYKVKEIVNRDQIDIKNLFKQLINVIPEGWQYQDLCRVRITYNGETFVSDDFVESEWHQESNFTLNGETVGKIEIFYKDMGFSMSATPFLEEEQKLLNSITGRIEDYLFQLDLKSSLNQWEQAQKDLENNKKAEWLVILEVLEKMDGSLFSKICRRMLNHLCWRGIEEAQNMLGRLSMKINYSGLASPDEINIPSRKIIFSASGGFYRQIFDLAAKTLSDEEILTNVRKWIKEDKISFLVNVLENGDTSLAEISGAVSRYHHLGNDQIEISSYVRSNINALFMQRLFTEQLEFIKLAREYIDINDFYTIFQHSIYPNNSHGKLGGKSAGLFISGQLLKSAGVDIKTPKTWYISSDYMLLFLYYNNLEEALEQKYKTIEEIRTDYPNMIQVFKNSNFPIDFINGLSVAIEDFGDKPVIVRSSSLLEDRYGTAFSGKYKSLFLTNQGTREEKLAALTDAISEVYASTFGPDPIEYRKEHGLLEYHEEMAIILQEVVGTRVGNYFFPQFAGVAFSYNDFRWSPRIKREDGLLRIVPGLGTRAVDRISDDYPVLVCPGNPAIKVNPDPDEAARYSPHELDVINLSENKFETVKISKILKECGRDYPEIEKIVSVYTDNLLVNRNIYQIDFAEDDLVVTLDSLIHNTDFIKRMKTVIENLNKQMNSPVDVEFAYCNGEIYLLQCRPQAIISENLPSPIPQDLSEKDILFTAHKYISNGQVNNITHVVYVDPERYNSLESMEKLKKVGTAVGKLNSILPKRQFILMGPGRWGSRGDIKLGVSVGYSDINNTAMLIEIACKKGSYLPELSFGTHFFQDLVESSIRYLPLYPDSEENILQETFLTRANNILPKLLPEFKELADTVFVVDIPEDTHGKKLRILMNDELGEAVGFFTSRPGKNAPDTTSMQHEYHIDQEEYWRWRFSVAEKIAESMDDETRGKFGVKAFYVFGSTKNATAGPKSDIDLLIHVNDSAKQKEALSDWLKGWSTCLGYINYLRTGYKTEGLLDVHLITDEDIEKKDSFAIKIGAVTDAARELPLGGKKKSG